MPDWLRKCFDPVSGLIAATMMGTIVWFINVSHGVGPATTAALKQLLYTFLMGGLIAQMCRYLAVRPWPAFLSVGAATIVPTLITTSATYFVHSLKGTPEPLLSTLPVVVLSIPLFACWAIRLKKHSHENRLTDGETNAIG